MTRINEIFEAADVTGMGLTEYIAKNFHEKAISELETNIRSEIDYLRSEITSFMKDVEVPKIDINLATASGKKLNQMQKRIKSGLSIKQSELENMGFSDLIESHGNYLEKVYAEFI